MDGRGAERKDYIRAEKAKEKKGKKIIQNRKTAKRKSNLLAVSGKSQ